MSIQNITPEIQEQLNLSALLLQKHFRQLDLASWYGFNIDNQLNINIAKQILEQKNIRSSKHLRNVLYGCEMGTMISQKFLSYANKLSNYKDDEYKQLLSKIEDPQQKSAYTVIYRHRFGLKTTALRGYEIAWYVFLMRLGYALNYISVEEIVLRLADIDRLAKRYFKNWGEFHLNVCIGNAYKHGEIQPDKSSYPGSDTLWHAFQRLHTKHNNWFKQW